MSKTDPYTSITNDAELLLTLTRSLNHLNEFGIYSDVTVAYCWAVALDWLRLEKHRKDRA